MVEFLRNLLNIVVDASLAASEIFFESPLYAYYSAGHIVTIVIVFALVLLAIPLSIGKKRYADQVFAVAAIVDALVVAGLIISSVVTGDYNLEWYVPLHICNVFMLLIPLCAVFKGKFRAWCMDFFFFGGILGCTLYTLFPMTTMLYLPVLHPASISVTVHHVIIGSLGVYLFVSGCYRKFSWIRAMSVIYVLILGSLIANTFLDTNFLFLNEARNGFPVNEFYRLLGDFAILFIVAFLTAIALLVQLAFFLFDKVKAKTLYTVIKSVGQASGFDRYEESRVYKLFMKSEVVKDLKNKENFFNKLYTSVFTAETIEFLKGCTLEQLVDYDYMHDNLKKLGLIKNFLSNFSFLEARRIRKIQKKLALEAESA